MPPNRLTNQIVLDFRNHFIHLNHTSPSAAAEYIQNDVAEVMATAFDIRRRTLYKNHPSGDIFRFSTRKGFADYFYTLEGSTVVLLHFVRSAYSVIERTEAIVAASRQTGLADYTLKQLLRELVRPEPRR